MLSIIYSLNFSFTQLLLYGVQVGHSFTNSLFYASWLIFSYCQEILILNLYKTFLGMRSGLISVGAVCKMGGPVWFINLDPAAGIIVRSHAKFCGEFSATSIWINGLISNYNGVYNTFIKFKKIALSAFTAKNKSAFSIFKPWYFTRSTWPRAVFVSSVSNSYSPTKEALQLSIPCLGIVDTNTYTHIVSIPIPGNDESIDCLVFYNDFVAQFILSQKYLSITSWFFNIRKGRRFLGFKNWVLTKGKGKKKPKSNSLPLIKFNFNFIKHFNLGMRAFFSQNKKYTRNYEEHIKIFEGNDVFQRTGDNLAPNLFLALLRSREYFIKASNLSGYQKCWFVDKFIYTPYLQGAYFRKKLFNKMFRERKLASDRFYKTHLHWSNLKFFFLSKFLKFFLFYNFAHYIRIPKKRSFPDNTSNFLGVIYFKLVADYFVNPAHPFPVEVDILKGYTKHFNFSFSQNSSKYEGKLKTFKKLLSRNIEPKIYNQKKTFRENNIAFIKQVKLAFRLFLKFKLPLYYSFMKSCLPEPLYEKQKALIKSYYVDRQKEKLSYISPKFIVNPWKSNYIKINFLFKIKRLLNKKQKGILEKIFQEGLIIDEDSKKYTNYKHNRHFPLFFFHQTPHFKMYTNFVLFVKFVALKNKNFKLPAKIIKNIKNFFQKMYSAHKIRYLKKNWYLTNLEKFNIAKLSDYKRKKIKLALKMELKRRRLNRRPLKGLISKRPFGPLRGFRGGDRGLIKFSKSKVSKIKSAELISSELYESNYRRPLRLTLVNSKNNERLTKYYFLQMVKKYKKRAFKANFAFRLNLLRGLVLKKNNAIFNLRRPFSFKQFLSKSKVFLGWLVFSRNFNIKFYWKYQSDLLLFPRWYFLYFPSLIKGNKEAHLNFFTKINSLDSKNLAKFDSSLSKFFYLTCHSPYYLKFSYLRRFLNNYSIKHRSKRWRVKVQDLYTNNISLKFKRFIKTYGHVWL